MKIATFNIENLFYREENLIRRTTEESVTNWSEKFETLMVKEAKQSEDYVRMRELSFLLELHKAPFEPYLVMRRKYGNLYLRQPTVSSRYRTSELSNWDEWIKLSTLPIN